MTAQNRAVSAYRARLQRRGLARFEVVGRDGDRELIRALARRLAEEGPEAQDLRATVAASVGVGAKRGGILAALRRSPLVGGELDLARDRGAGRPVDL